MARRRRREPVWPLVLVAGVVLTGATGLWMTGLPGLEDPARALDSASGEADIFLPSHEDRVRVEVLNAGGVPGAAGQVTELLRLGGFDVVYYGNAASFGREGTLVLDRTGRMDAAEQIGRTLEVTEPIAFEPDSTLLVDITVLVGSDWAELRSLEMPADGEGIGLDPRVQASGPYAWWDPRRILELLDGTR